MPRETDLGIMEEQLMWRAYWISPIELPFVLLRCFFFFTFLCSTHSCPTASHEPPLLWAQLHPAIINENFWDWVILKKTTIKFPSFSSFFFQTDPSKSHPHCLLSLKNFAAHKRHTHCLRPSISALVYCFSLDWQGAESDISPQGFRSNAPVCVR